MNYARLARAAIATDAEAHASSHAARPTPAPAPQEQLPKTLFATRALETKAGRVIGCRLRKNQLEVAVVTPTGTLWKRAEGVITEAQALKWIASSEFELR